MMVPPAAWSTGSSRSWEFPRFALSPSRQSLEGLASLDEGRGYTRGALEPADDRIDIERIEFNAAANSTRLVSGHQCRSGTQEGVDDDVAPVAEVQKGVLDIAVGLTVG
jgi:hypothetical protein